MKNDGRSGHCRTRPTFENDEKLYGLASEI